MNKELEKAVTELKAVGQDVEIKLYNTSATSKDKNGVEYIASAECEQVTILGLDSVAGFINDTLYRKAYLVALGGARSQFINEDGTSVKKSRKKLTPIIE